MAYTLYYWSLKYILSTTSLPNIGPENCSSNLVLIFRSSVSPNFNAFNKFFFYSVSPPSLPPSLSPAPPPPRIKSFLWNPAQRLSPSCFPTILKVVFISWIQWMYHRATLTNDSHMVLSAPKRGGALTCIENLKDQLIFLKVSLILSYKRTWFNC